MILSKRVALGGVQLDELHDAIVIRSIDLMRWAIFLSIPSKAPPQIKRILRVSTFIYS